MPTAATDKTDAALEAQVFWIRYRKEIVAVLLLALLSLIGLAIYRLYTDRRESAAAALFASSKRASDFERVINNYGDTAAAAGAYLLFADEERKAGKFAEANTTLQRFIEKFPRHELVSTARMAIAANWESMGKQDEAFATYQQIVSSNATSFNAPYAMLAQVQILQAKNRPDEARRLCETILTRYSESYAAREALRLLRALKPAPPSAPASPSPAAKP